MNNMKKYISSICCKSTLAVAIIALFATACNNKQELLFEKSASDRALDMIEQCEKVLLAHPNGWQMVYEVPNKTVGGQFTIQMQFMENKSVRMWADFLDKPTDSSYAFSLYDGPVLTFDTPGALTELANPAIQPFYDSKKGKGYFGENDFVITSVSAEKITLRGLKYGKVVELTPLKEPANLTDKGVTEALSELAYQLTKYGNSIQLMSADDKLNKINFVVPELSYYIGTASEVPQFKMILQPMADGEKAVEYVITPTKDGLSIEPALVVTGKSYAEFVFDDSGKRFVAKGNDRVWINLQATSPLTLALLEGGKYCRDKSLFYAVDMSDMAKKYMGKEECEKVFKNFVELQFYNQPGLKSLTFMHKPDGQNGAWQNLVFSEIVVIDDAAGIYQFKVKGLEGKELDAALKADGLNAVNVLAIYFTSLGKNGQVKIVERENGLIRISSVAEPRLWIDLKFATW